MGRNYSKSPRTDNAEKKKKDVPVGAFPGSLQKLDRSPCLKRPQLTAAEWLTDKCPH